MTEPASFPATAEPIEHPNLSAEDPIEPTGLTIDLTTNLLTSIPIELTTNLPVTSPINIPPN